MPTLDSLSPARQAQYDALVPQIELAARKAVQARGMFYSGDATDSETKAKADLLAKLAEEDATAAQQTAINRENIDAGKAAQENATKASNRNANLGLIGSGVGAATTLAGLKFLNPGANGMGNVVSLGNGQFGRIVNGQIQPIPVAGAPGVGGASLSPATGGGVGGLDKLAGTGPGFEASAGLPPITAGTAPSTFNVATGGTGVGMPAAPTPAASMWNDPLEAAGGVAAGAAGGLGGYLAANKINGGGKNTALASGLGGLAGAGLAAYAGSGNPWLTGLGALGGSLGGGLLGNLFK